MTSAFWLTMADPVHGLIRFDRTHPDHRLLLEIINSYPFQRLRRIRQMGLAEFVFPGATHTRFMHCIGTTWLAMQAIEHLASDPATESILEECVTGTNVKTRTALLVAVLLHDIGHPPLSHTLEYALSLDKANALHDYYWNQRIIEEAPDLLDIWGSFYPDMPLAIQRLMGAEEGHKKHFLADLVSSQLDMDRLDYLVRDSHYLGVQYGRIETERLITNMAVGRKSTGDKILTLREEALPGLEHYLFGRHQAYKMASHVLDKASEMLLKKTLQRFAQLTLSNELAVSEKSQLLVKLIRDPKSLSVEEYLELDDGYLWELVKDWAKRDGDSLLKTLASRLLRHDLYKVIEINPYLNHQDNSQHLDMLKEQLNHHAEQEGIPAPYYYDIETIPARSFYQQNGRPIWIQTKHGPVVEFPAISTFAEAPKAPDRQLLFVWDKVAKVLAKNHLESCLA